MVKREARRKPSFVELGWGDWKPVFATHHIDFTKFFLYLCRDCIPIWCPFLAGWLDTAGPSKCIDWPIALKMKFVIVETERTGGLPWTTDGIYY